MNDYLVVIPARYNSKRLPGKPLININGIPMIIRTYNQCKKAVPETKIIVATDNKKIKKICNNFKIKSIITSKKCLTGTDRLAEVAKKIKKKFSSDIYLLPSTIFQLKMKKRLKIFLKI